MSPTDLDKLYRRICRKNPPPTAMQSFKSDPDRHSVVEFLVGKLNAYLVMSRANAEWDVPLEWGAISACRLLGGFKATEAILPMIEILDDVKYDYDFYIYSATLIALEGMGQDALEPAYCRYERDRLDEECAGVWLHVLAKLGIRDERIPPALIEYMQHNPTEAVGLMGDYGDPVLLPTVEEFVMDAVDTLNTEKIDPFAYAVRLWERSASDYIEGRASLVLLREGLSFRDPAVPAKIELLDRQLLRHSDFAIHDPSNPSLESVVARSMGRKVGRNEPCLCGSGKKFKNCCERL